MVATTVQLHEVTRSIEKSLLALEVSEDQKAFIAPIEQSAKLAASVDHFQIAILADEVVVGYALYFTTLDRAGKIPQQLKDSASRYTEIVRFLVDRHFQRRGIGTVALGMLVDHIRLTHGATRIWMSYRKRNTASGKLFRKVGFRDTDVQEEQEFVLVFETGPKP